MNRQKWKRILYEDQGLPDHYVDESFLEELKKNLHVSTYEYWRVVKASGVVTQQICSVSIFVMVFVCFNLKILAPDVLVAICSFLLLLGYCLHWLLTWRCDWNHRTVLDDIKTVTIFCGFSYCLSPILVSLTETVATDTIYAMTTVMLLANLCFHDYGADAEMVSGVLSLNTGLFASMCLASRLHSTHHAFATVIFAVGVFSLWPALRRNIQQQYPSVHDLLTVVLSVATVTALSFLSYTAAILLTLVIVFITFVCPAWLVTLQTYKNNIHGPWDEAVIKE